MGKLDPNTLIGIINGRIGDLVFARTNRRSARLALSWEPLPASLFRGRSGRISLPLKARRRSGIE